MILALHEVWPKAPLFTAVYNPKTAPWAAEFDIRTSFLQKFPLAKTSHEFYPWLTPVAFESFNFDEFDIVISMTSADAKGIVTKPKTLHICYCLTPTRYLWSGYSDYFHSPVFRFLSSPLVAYLRLWDRVAAARPDEYIAISENVRKRIKKYYGRESEVIYPPVDINKFEIRNSKSETNSKYFLVVSRLVAYKRIDVVVRAFNKLGFPLKIIGSGRAEKGLRKIAQGNIEFLGNLTDEDLIGYYQGCQALIFPTDEDFGLAPLEAQACGKPVIALKSGGVLETVVEGKTGEFFYPQTSEALASVVVRFDASKYDIKDCRRSAERFSKESFKKKFKKFVEERWEKLKKEKS